MNRLRYWRRWTVDLRVDSVSDVPEHIRFRSAVIVASGTRDKWLVFDCPCRRGHRVMVNLDHDNTPCWRVQALVPLTLTPSVDEHSRGGHCHYVVRDGRVHWVGRTDHR